MKRQLGQREFEQKITASLREKGYKLTQQRLEIVRFLSYNRSHPGAMDIFLKVRKRAPHISMSTVYYTLDMMKKEGLIQELEYYNTDNRYDINVSDHINLVCTRCGRITDFMGDVHAFANAVEKETGFKPSSMRFEYYGICRDCTGVKGR